MNSLASEMGVSEGGSECVAGRQVWVMIYIRPKCWLSFVPTPEEFKGGSYEVCFRSEIKRYLVFFFYMYVKHVFLFCFSSCFCLLCLLFLFIDASLLPWSCHVDLFSLTSIHNPSLHISIHIFIKIHLSVHSSFSLSSDLSFSLTQVLPSLP